MYSMSELYWTLLVVSSTVVVVYRRLRQYGEGHAPVPPKLITHASPAPTKNWKSANPWRFINVVAIQSLPLFPRVLKDLLSVPVRWTLAAICLVNQEQLQQLQQPQQPKVQ